jgi:hypothetical protein
MQKTRKKGGGGLLSFTCKTYIVHNQTLLRQFQNTAAFLPSQGLSLSTASWPELLHMAATKEGVPALRLHTACLNKSNVRVRGLLVWPKM